MQSALSVFGLTETSDWAEAHDAYRRLMKTWHPDRFLHDPALYRLAEERSREINAAYQEVKDLLQRGHSSTAAAAGAARAASTMPPIRKEHVQEPFIFVYSKTPSRRLGRGFIRRCVETAAACFSALYIVATMGTASWSELSKVLAQQKVSSAENVAPAALRTRTPKPSAASRISEFDEQVRRKSSVSKSALIASAIHCDAEQAEQLLKRGADINQKDSGGETAFSWSIRQQCDNVTRLLFAKGAQIDTVAHSGYTPRQWARWSQNLEALKLLH